MFRESAPSCHDEEACSRVRHGHNLKLKNNKYLLLLNRLVNRHPPPPIIIAVVYMFIFFLSPVLWLPL